MLKNEGVIKVVKEWIEKAENDLTNASNTLKMGKYGPMDTICFHAQQCAEKYLKAFLTLKRIDFPKTHDIGELLVMIPAPFRPRLEIKEQRLMTSYATVTRYPGDYEPISFTETRHAVSIARRVRKEIRALLPKEILQKIKK
jgi:HEPN domain-containing protein